VGLNGGRGLFSAVCLKAAYDSTLAGLKEDVDYALELGVREVMVWEGAPAVQNLASMMLDTLVSLFQEAIGSAARRKACAGQPHLLTLGMVRIWQLDRLGREHFGILFDFCHFGVGKPNGYVEAIHRQVITQHSLFDSDQRTSELHLAPGKGQLDLDAMDNVAPDRLQRHVHRDMYGYPLPEQVYGGARYRAALK
jgi:sugar phosphate isomerase/epimerase